MLWIMTEHRLCVGTRRFVDCFAIVCPFVDYANNRVIKFIQDCQAIAVITKKAIVECEVQRFSVAGSRAAFLHFGT